MSSDKVKNISISHLALIAGMAAIFLSPQVVPGPPPSESKDTISTTTTESFPTDKDAFRGSFLHHLDSQSLCFLTKVAKIYEHSSGKEIDFTSETVALRITEFLRGHSSSKGEIFPGLEDSDADNLAVSLATDLHYILRNPQPEDLSVQREQYLELLDLSVAEFEKILGEYDLDQETEDEARAVFEETVQLSLSYFDQPRLAALSLPRLTEEMATLKVNVATAAQNDGRSFMDKQFPHILNDPNAPEQKRKAALSVSLRSAANYLASIPFQAYIVEGTNLGQSSNNPDLNKLSTISGITAEHKKNDNGPFFVIDYFYRPDEVSRILRESDLPDEQR